MKTQKKMEILRLIENIEELNPEEMDRLLELITEKYQIVGRWSKHIIERASELEEDFIILKRELKHREAEFTRVLKLYEEQKAELEKRFLGRRRRRVRRCLEMLDLYIADLQNKYGEAVGMHKYTAAAATGFKIAIGLATVAVGVAYVLRV